MLDACSRAPSSTQPLLHRLTAGPAAGEHRNVPTTPKANAIVGREVGSHEAGASRQPLVDSEAPHQLDVAVCAVRAIRVDPADHVPAEGAAGVNRRKELSRDLVVDADVQD